MERLNSFSKSNPRNSGRCSGVAAKERREATGVDLPSMDELDSKLLQNHHALAGAGIAIIESLDLRDVAPGIYNFAALPLKIAGADGAPVRAVLWRD